MSEIENEGSLYRPLSSYRWIGLPATCGWLGVSSYQNAGSLHISEIFLIMEYNSNQINKQITLIWSVILQDCVKACKWMSLEYSVCSLSS